MAVNTPCPSRGGDVARTELAASPGEMREDADGASSGTQQSHFALAGGFFAPWGGGDGAFSV